MSESPALAADWVEAARVRPVAFAQVREDAAVDLEVLAACPAGARAAMIASGGCTAAALAGSGRAASILLVDANPAQLALARLKLTLLEEEPERRAALLGHVPLEGREERLNERMARLGLEAGLLGPIAGGLDFCGRYESLFRRLADLTSGPDAALPAACADAFALPALTALFGPAAVSRAARPFAEHFAARLKAGAARPGAARNPYLSLMLHARLPAGEALPWMRLPRRPPSAALEFYRGGMREALNARGHDFDFIHLSNILDWLAPEERAALLEAAGRALKPKGFILIRRLNSDFTTADREFGIEWLDARAERMHGNDRSAIYSGLHLGRKA